MTTRSFQFALVVVVIGIVVALMAGKAFKGDQDKSDASTSSAAPQYLPKASNAHSPHSKAADVGKNDKPFRVIKQGQVVGREGK